MLAVPLGLQIVQSLVRGDPNGRFTITVTEKAVT